MVERVLDSAKYIAENSEYVKIPIHNVKQAAEKILKNMEERNYSTGTWNEHFLNPKELNQKQ
ncbi:unnamed protein product [Cunninghamella echinulata]